VRAFAPVELVANLEERFRRLPAEIDHAPRELLWRRRWRMAANGLSIEMLPARHGDALWIEWGPPDQRHRMLIDGGPTDAFEDVRHRIEQLDAAQRRFDLMVVTHIDLDHIGGAIELLEDDTLGVHYDDIWFNDYHHLSDEAPTRGALQGEFLGDLLTDAKLPWNKAFRGGAVRVEPNRPLPRVRLDGDLTLVLLSPTPEKLTALRSEWEKTLAEAKKKEAERAAEESAGTVTRGGRIVFGGDTSKANGSSIAMIVEHQDERWLLAGDAHADVLLSGLQRYGREVDEHPVRLDGFKLPHHGSARNITQDLLAAIKCERFLVSTNGAYFKHPDSACLDLIVRHTDRPDLVFNYRSEFTSPWAEPSGNYTSTFAETSPVTARRNERTTATMKLPSWAHASSTSPAAAAATEPAAAPAARRSKPRPRPALAVKVIHGSLERAPHPVMVGHYQATALSGAEGFVDRRYAGRLLDRLATDKYPGEIGESLLIDAPRRKHPPGGALVVGLGEYGELTPNRLVETVRAALVRHALDQADRGTSAPVTLGISSVLLGATGRQGLSISSSVRALVDGVCEANRDLRRRDGTPRALYTELELWERNAPEAELAFLSFADARAAKDRAATTPADDDDDDDTAPAEFAPPTSLDMADGSLSESLPVDSYDAAWWRVRVSERSGLRSGTADGAAPPAELELEFTVGGRLARTGTVLHRVERRRLERILRDAVATTDATSGLHTTLFELLFPNQLKWDLMAAQDIQLEVDDVTADIPWEMLAARNPEHGTRGQLALRAALIRQIRLPELRTVRRAGKPTALVIGNPPVGALAGSLDGAFAEAKAVSEALGHGGYAVTELCYDDAPANDATTSAIETALFADDYRIIHIAAHGFYQPDDPTRTGVAIGPDDFLTASMFRQLNVIPDVVFLNCCHLGAVAFGIERGAIEFTRRNLNRLGASLARELIDCGVRAVVVAGWAVHDRAATKFANSFYRAMLKGRTFGTAVHDARWAAWKEAPTHSTWGAYQCYGDGGYSLPRVGNPDRQPAQPPPPRTDREAIRSLDKLVNRIKTVGIEASADDDRTRTRMELATIERAAKKRGWSERGRVCEAIAEGWKAIGDFDKAIAWYESAMNAADGRMTLAAVEQLANLKDRRAAALMRSPALTATGRQRATELIEESMRTITLLEQLSGSGERYALRGGHYKRRAITADGAERVEALEQASRAYLQAYEHDRNAYTLFNYLQVEELRRRITGEPSRVEALTADLERHLGVVDHRTYWASVAVADGRLTKALLDDDIDTSQDELVELYETAFDNRSTWSERASTLDHLLDLAELHPDEQQAKALRSLHRTLTAIT
jgi:beta-lactamase superfamily II metal-dependent hydrolase/tetratricopeptide (TPR) repeat protein